MIGVKQIAACCFGLGLLAACSKKEPLYSLSILQGEWIRISGEKPEYDSMRVRVDIDYAVLLAIPSNDTTYFQVGDIKWRDISPRPVEDIDAHFRFYELSSTGDYLSGNITVVDDSTIQLTKGYWIDGDKQTWRKQP